MNRSKKGSKNSTVEACSGPYLSGGPSRMTFELLRSPKQVSLRRAVERLIFSEENSKLARQLQSKKENGSATSAKFLIEVGLCCAVVMLPDFLLPAAKGSETTCKGKGSGCDILLTSKLDCSATYEEKERATDQTMTQYIHDTLNPNQSKQRPLRAVGQWYSTGWPVCVSYP